ncbi:MAG: acetyl-CoA carboxylase carboxyltransferase subunit alpha [Alphaproteobacteria bacterium]|nr:acetyl-CoA carboxylase carboxyltransferase subunit alpha [Alphaproteobacteria bacterium]
MSLFKRSARGIRNNDRGKYDSVRRLMWLKCESCGRLIYYKDFKENARICPKCNHVFLLTPPQRFNLLFDNNNWTPIKLPRVSDDPLCFIDRKPYAERLAEAREETGFDDAVSAADGKISGAQATIAVMNPEFMMGSMGRAVGDGIVASIEHAISKKQPYIIVVASGGARMQENVLSLMQMARTTAAVNRLHEAKLPYIVILTDPTYGGVTASFAMLGDIHIAEQGARIGFAGRLVIEQNMRERLPADFQTAEYLLEHGMVDIVAKRSDLKEVLDKIMAVVTKQPNLAGEIKVVQPKIDDRNTFRSNKKEDSTPAYEKVMLARNENRPHFLDYIGGLVTEWVPLSGDRTFGEDSALLGGLGFFRGMPVMIMGQELGRDIATRQKHRFGMPTPEGYRKAARLMRMAEKFGIPIISLVDTSGAFAGKEGEERGQSEAVAKAIQTGLSVATPYVAVIVGQGGSGGAIAIATGDKVLMLENAIYSVIAPESCASILWKDNKMKAHAAEAMKLTAGDLSALHIIDGIVPEPEGGAHKDWQTTMENLGAAVTNALQELSKIPAAKLPIHRAEKFFAMTRDIK